MKHNVYYQYRTIIIKSLTMEFSLAHRTYTFPEEAIRCYKWLASMFGLSDIGTKKEKLSFNLQEYLPDVEIYIIREMVESLDCLHYYYNNDWPKKITVVNNVTVIEYDSEKIRRTECFLSNGPGATKGIDVPYQCTRCKLKELRPDIQDTTVIKHELERVSNTTVLCINCGILFTSLNNDHLQIPIHCSMTGPICRHNWV